MFTLKNTSPEFIALASICIFVLIIYGYNKSWFYINEKPMSSPGPDKTASSITISDFNFQDTNIQAFFPRSIHGQTAVRLFDTPYLVYPNSMMSIQHAGFPSIPLEKSLEAHYGDPIGNDVQDLTSITYFKVNSDADIENIQKINEATFKNDTDFELIPVSISGIKSWLAIALKSEYQSDFRLVFPSEKAMIVIKFAKGRGKEEIVSTAKEYIDFLNKPKETKKLPETNILTDIVKFEELMSDNTATSSAKR